jgi:hypothetical protein
LVLVGSFLTWVTVDVGFAEFSSTGTATTDGKLTAIAAGVMTLAGMALLARGAVRTAASYVGVVASCSGDDSATEPTSEPSVATTPRTSPEPPLPPAPLSGLAAWSDAIDLPPIGDTSSVQGMAVRNGELIAVGFAQFGDERRGGLWHSGDGVT